MVSTWLFHEIHFLLYKLICYWALYFIRGSNISSHNYWKKPLYSRTIQFGTLGSLCWNHCCCLGSLYCRSTVLPSGAKYDCSRNEWVGRLVFQNLKVDFFLRLFSGYNYGGICLCVAVLVALGSPLVHRTRQNHRWNIFYKFVAGREVKGEQLCKVLMFSSEANASPLLLLNWMETDILWRRSCGCYWFILSPVRLQP